MKVGNRGKAHYAYTHGKSNTVEFKIWQGIKHRCSNPTAFAYHRYGGRGIRMSKEWADNFSTFFADMGKRPSARHSIERRNNDGDYRKENCYWATREEQCRNRMTSFTYCIYSG